MKGQKRSASEAARETGKANVTRCDTGGERSERHGRWGEIRPLFLMGWSFSFLHPLNLSS